MDNQYGNVPQDDLQIDDLKGTSPHLQNKEARGKQEVIPSRSNEKKKENEEEETERNTSGFLEITVGHVVLLILNGV